MLSPFLYPLSFPLPSILSSGLIMLARLMTFLSAKPAPRLPRRTSPWLFAALPFLLACSLFGQDQTPGAPPPAPKESPQPAPAALPGTPPASEPTPSPAGQDSPPQAEVPPVPVLSPQDFLRLWTESNLEDRLLRQRPPLEGVIRSASYTGEILGTPESPTGLNIQATLLLQSFQKGWSVVPLSSEPLPIVKADTGNAFLTLGDAGYLALLPEEGTYQIQLNLVFPVDSVEGVPSAAIKLPRSPVSSFQGSLSGSGWTVTTSGGEFPIQSVTQGSDTSFSFSPGAVTSFHLQWERAGDNKATEPVIFAETGIVTLIRPGSVRSEANVNLQIPRAPLESLRLSLPMDHELLSVSGESLKVWKLHKEENSQSLEIWFSSPQSEQYQLRLTLEQAIPQVPFSGSLPALQVEGALRQSGSFEIVEDRDLITTLESLQHLTRQASTFQAAAHQRHLGHYRFLRSDYAATLKTVESTPKISVLADTVFHLEDAHSSFVTSLRMDVQDRAILQSAILLPAGFELSSVEGEPVQNFEVKGNRLSISYSAPQLGMIQLELRGKKLRRESAAEEQDVPHFTVENAQEFQGRVRLEFPPSIQVEVRDGATPMALRPAPQMLEYQNAPALSSLLVTRKPPLVEARSQMEIRFQHHETSITCNLTYQIRHRFPERLLLRIPANLAPLVEFQSSTLSVVDRDVSSALASPNRTSEEGLYTYWALHDPNQTLGEHQAELRITDKLKDPQYNQPLITPALLIVPLQTDRLEGGISVHPDENVVLKTVTENGLRPLPQDLGLSGTGQSFAFTTGEAHLSYSITRLRYVELPSLAVDLAEITHIVSGDGSITTEAAYRVIADRPAELEIELPPGARMNSQVFCNDQPISPRETTESNLLAVTIPAPAKDANPPGAIVRFTYDLPSAFASKSLGNRGDLPIPVASLRNTRILDSRTSLYLPPAYRYFGLVTPMTLQSSIPGWIQAKRYLAKLLPALETWSADGADFSSPGSTAAAPIPAFTYRIPLRKEGQLFTFIHSAAPDAIVASYLSQRYATLLEAGAFFLALFFGILISRQALEAKLVFLVFAGVLALVAASFAAPHMAVIYHAVSLGAVSSVAFWLFAGVLSLFQNVRFHSKPSPATNVITPFTGPGSLDLDDEYILQDESRPRKDRATTEPAQGGITPLPSAPEDDAQPCGDSPGLPSSEEPSAPSSPGTKS